MVSYLDLASLQVFCDHISDEKIEKYAGCDVANKMRSYCGGVILLWFMYLII